MFSFPHFPLMSLTLGTNPPPHQTSTHTPIKLFATCLHFCATHSQHYDEKPWQHLIFFCCGLGSLCHFAALSNIEVIILQHDLYLLGKPTLPVLQRKLLGHGVTQF